MNILSFLFNKFRKFAIGLNENGVPLPLLRDNIKNRGSFPLTMFFISFNVALITLVGKITNFLGEVDYSNVLWLMGVTGSFWVAEVMGKKISLDNTNKTLSLEGSEEKKDG